MGLNFPFNCPRCGHENYAMWAHIGRQVNCGGCRRATTVPAPLEVLDAEDEFRVPIRFGCVACGRQYSTKPALVGQKIRCSGCGAGVRVPATSLNSVWNDGTRVVLNARSGITRATVHAPQVSVSAFPDARVDRSFSTGKPLAPPGGVEPRPSVAVAHAPQVAVSAFPDHREDHPVLLGDQLASFGGLEPRRSAAVELPSRAETIEQARQEAAEREVAATKVKAEKAKRAKKTKRKKTGDLDLQETLTLIGGVSVVVGVLGFLAWSFPDFQYFLGGLVAVMGLILYLLGARALNELAGHEGFFQLMAYRFFPPYQLWFVLTHWAAARDYFAFFVSGLVVMIIGGAVIMTSPASKRAAESDREYQKAFREAVYGEVQLAPPPVKKAEKDSEKR